MDSTLSLRLRVCLVRRNMLYVLVLEVNPCLRSSGIRGVTPRRLTRHGAPYFAETLRFECRHSQETKLVVSVTERMPADHWREGIAVWPLSTKANRRQ